MLKFFYKFIFIFIFILLLSATKILWAGILLEPFLGYALSGSVDQNINNTPFTWDYTGPALGARVGYYNTGIMIGFHFDLINETWNGTGNKISEINETPQKLRGENVGIFFGYQMPIPVRLWSTYYISDKYLKKDDEGQYSNGDAYLGMGFSFGVGYVFWGRMATNLEYRSFILDYVRIASDQGTYVLDNGREIILSEIFFSVSYPFTF
ncbi:MAG: outer membrane beta-barrel protein [Oligoflexia bacterium]|nr:outer membrane beta-barrel protein [Oligoflexia bacterium]